MDRKIRVAAIGDNCIDYYDSLNESYPGGNPVNVAVYIKRLGGESSYTGAVGTDSFGKIMISAIQNKGVDTSHIQVLDGKTAVTHVDIVDGDRVFGKYEEGVLADFKLREQDISFIKKHDLAVTGIWGMIEDELPLISKEIPVASLLKDKKEFEGFLSMVSAEYIHKGIPELIKELYAGKICQHADLDMLINQYPCGLAYALALIDTTDYRSITPGWVLYN